MAGYMLVSSAPIPGRLLFVRASLHRQEREGRSSFFSLVCEEVWGICSAPSFLPQCAGDLSVSGVTSSSVSFPQRQIYVVEHRGCVSATTPAKTDAFVGDNRSFFGNTYEKKFSKTFSNGCLGSHNDEGRSKTRYSV